MILLFKLKNKIFYKKNLLNLIKMPYNGIQKIWG
jgi:hypothetical protein